MNKNIILYEPHRTLLKPTIEHISRVCPLMHLRKMERANIQQAFVYDAVQDATTELTANQRVFCAGYYEDTAYETMRLEKSFNLQGIDPKYDYTLHEYCSLPDTKKEYFKVVFSTSVIEHVEDDREFLIDIISLLHPGGTGIITLDFQFGYKPGDRLPPTSLRFYTEATIRNELLPLIESLNCQLVDVPNWHDGENDFEYEGIKYCFSTLTFRKAPWTQSYL